MPTQVILSKYSRNINKMNNKKVIGLALFIGGFIAWKTYFFAGTGFAFLICVAMVVAGVYILLSNK
jgi:hypothetical protein